jgi:hypothetical protein
MMRFGKIFTWLWSTSAYRVPTATARSSAAGCTDRSYSKPVAPVHNTFRITFRDPD